MNNMVQQQLQQFAYSAMQNNQLMGNQYFSNAVSMFRNHQSKDLLSYANNLCKEYGMTYEDAKKKLGIS